MSTGNGLTLARAQHISAQLVDELGDACELIAVKGSVLREEPHPGDPIARRRAYCERSELDYVAPRRATDG